MNDDGIPNGLIQALASAAAVILVINFAFWPVYAPYGPDESPWELKHMVVVAPLFASVSTVFLLLSLGAWIGDSVTARSNKLISFAAALSSLSIQDSEGENSGKTFSYGLGRQRTAIRHDPRPRLAVAALSV